MEEQRLKVEIAVLGGGPAGYVAAIRAAQMGASVILIEKKDLGGVCMNIGCIPTKALLQSARTVTDIKKAKEFGISCHLDCVDWSAAVERKNRVVKNLNIGLSSLLQGKGVQVINGTGAIRSQHEIVVETGSEIIVVQCEKMILATGSSPLIPPLPGVRSEGVITSTEALSLSSLPESMVIIGAGVIGLEFASIFAASGVKITLLEALEHPLPDVDAEAVGELVKSIKRQGITLKAGAKVISIEKSEGKLSVTYIINEKEKAATGEYVLVAVGRKMNTEAFRALPIQMVNGAVQVDQYMETSVKDIYAAGDIVGGKLLAHLAYAQGRAAAENALGERHTVNNQAIPSCIYTAPELACVGVTEAEALAAGIPVKTGRFSMRQNGRALTLGEREGFVKIILDQDNVVIGAHILGAGASELISELTLAISARVKADILADMIHPHPTLSEAVWEASMDAIGRPIHKL